MINNIAINTIIQHEGFSKFAYQCSAGKWTIGYGKNIDKDGGIGITESEARVLLLSDVQRVEGELISNFSWYSELDDVRRAALVDMVYNLGMPRFKLFKKMISAIEKYDFISASDEMLDSKWARQVGQRANRLAEMMRRGIVLR